jgi:preprotein translocase subunit YajC
MGLSIAIFRAALTGRADGAPLREISMFITEALAQSTATPTDAGGLIGMILPLVMMMAVFWFLLIRPQQKKMKDYQAMIAAVAKGDTIVTNGGLIGKVVKVVDDQELLVEVGENVKVRVLRGGIAELRNKTVSAETK